MTITVNRRFDTCAVIGALAVIAVAGIIFASRARGIWLDEFWSQRLGNAETPFGLLITDRWLSDTHPPLANLLYRAVMSTGATSIQVQRMVLNIPAFAFMLVATTAFFRASPPESRAFPPVLFGVALSLPGSMEAFADFRSYGWQIAAITATFQYASRILSNTRLTLSEQALGGGALFLALSLHYVTGIVISFFVVGLFAALCVAHRWRQAAGIAAISIAAWGGLTISGLILLGRMRRDIDFGWILTSTPTALLLFGFVFVSTLLAAPLVTAFAAQGARRMMSEFPQRQFGFVLIWTLVASFIALIAVNLVTPIIIQRYLIGWQLGLATLIILMAEPVLAKGRWRLVAVTAFAGFMIVVGTFQAAKNAGWHENRDRIATMVRQCPATRVYALSPWRLKTARNSNAARRETIVINDGYRRLAQQGGFTLSVLDLDTTRDLTIDSRCPTLVWIEHLDIAYLPDRDYLLRVGRLVPSTAVETRLISSPSGIIAILRARSSDQNRLAIPK